VADPDEQEQLVTGYAGRLFLTVSFGWLLIQLARQLLPPLLPDIIESYGITSAQAGFALTVLVSLYAVLQYPSGRLSDQLTRKTLLVSGVGLLGGGFLVVWVAGSYPAFLLGMAVVGVGAGLYPTAARALLSDHFVSRRGQAFGLHTALGDVGSASSAGIAVAAVALATWQDAFLALAVVAGGLSLALHGWSRERYAFETVSLETRSTARRLFANPRLRWLLVGYVLFVFAWQGVVGFLPHKLPPDHGFSVGLASAGFAAVFVVGIVMKPVAGLLGDRIGRMRVGVGALLLAAVGLTGILAVERAGVLFLAIALCGAGLMSFAPVMQAFLMDRFPDDSMGGDLGGMRTVYVGLGSIGPTYVGYVAGVGSYGIAFLGLVACLLASAGIITANERRQ
jgi:MFS family permease